MKIGTTEIPQVKTLIGLLQERGDASGSLTAISAPGRLDLTYAALCKHVRSTAAELARRGLSRNDRIAVVLPNGPEMATAFLATAAAGVSAPLNPGYQAAEFEFYLTDLRARAVIVLANDDSPVRAVAAKLGVPVWDIEVDNDMPAGVYWFREQATSDCVTQTSKPADPDDVALVLHTSGTTSRPKIVPLTHRNLVRSARNIGATLSLAPGDTCLNVMPLFHIHGLVGAVLSTLMSGANVVCTSGFDANRFLSWMTAHRPTWYTAVPTMHQMVLEQLKSADGEAAFPQLRFVRSSSSALPPQVMKELESILRVPIVESYGMTEASHQMCSNPLADGTQKPGSVGKPTGLDVAIMNDAGDLLADGEFGEIVIRGENVTSGYEGNAQANAAAFTNGWFRTGDRGYRDADGYYYLTGRLKEIVNRGGEKISPREVDEVLLDHPDVRQAVAFAVPHPRLGEDLAAAVVLHPGRRTTEKTLRDFVFARVVSQKVPSRILTVDEIPKGPTGKLQRIGLYDKLESRFRAPVQEPETEFQEIVRDVWRELLEIEDVGIDDNFFYLGGDSLLATSLLSRICPAFEIDLTVGDLFRSPTIRGQAELIEQAVRGRLDLE